MDVLPEIKNTWLFVMVSGVIGACGITYYVIEALINKPLRNKLDQKTEELEKLKEILANVKKQYDIPDATIDDLSKSPINDKFENLNIIYAKLNESIKTVIKRNITSQIEYDRFSIMISTSDVNQNGETAFNVGFILPNNEIPQSLQFKLFPAQFMTVNSQDNVMHLFHLQLIASDPSNKSAMINVAILNDLRELLANQKITNQK